jgi:hypothetical protein
VPKHQTFPNAYIYKEYQSILTKAGIIIAIISKFSFAFGITLFPIIQSARNGTLIIMGIKIL